MSDVVLDKAVESTCFQSRHRRFVQPCRISALSVGLARSRFPSAGAGTDLGLRDRRWPTAVRLLPWLDTGADRLGEAAIGRLSR